MCAASDLDYISIQKRASLVDKRQLCRLHTYLSMSNQRWHYFESYQELKDLFWRSKDSVGVNGKWRAIQVARRIGILFRYGFRWDEAALRERIIVENDPGQEGELTNRWWTSAAGRSVPKSKEKRGWKSASLDLSPRICRLGFVASDLSPRICRPGFVAPDLSPGNFRPGQASQSDLSPRTGFPV
ncbi:hypothetical protein K458DRAFT_486711 [Lentithecium fluviatile CBS 122367]|uniref:Uncharacterized protein n=1 Tax=Lentithecium fluviatile CBS 122367 TaxID=1168545 RepID=A0A6G1J3D4_9PLEO|nr:hypothetical protein K458DRAFT_486711 [Lentithecium fluviatile CBS 122367]